MSSQQVAPNPQIPQDISDRLRRKLEKHLAAKEAKAKPRRKSTGRKPAYAKHLTKNSAAYALTQCDAKTRWLELLQSPDARLRFEVLRYLTDRLEGKAFTAINPDERPQAPVNQDNRLQVAIQNLIVPAAKPRKALKQQPLTLAGDVVQPNPIQAAAKPGDGQEN
jgi:hypothetical protein